MGFNNNQMFKISFVIQQETQKANKHMDSCRMTTDC